jgi:glyoxylase-like metal-dependent hydrolase (beta-lactamase superfamily II)
MEPGPVYEVVAVRYATRSLRKSECYYGYHVYGEPDAPLQMDYFFWLLRGEAGTILVDSGFDPAVGERRGRTVLMAPLEALARLGVRSQDVAQIVVTHLHYDHIGNLAAFPSAQLLVHPRELEFWAGPFASRAQVAAHVEPGEVAHVVEADHAGRVRRLSDSETLFPGVEAIRVGGHSPGQLVLVVAGADGPIVLASDSTHYYEELDLERPFEILTDLEEMYAGYAVLKELAARPGAVLLPGHDPEVMSRFAPLDGADGLAVVAR